jgi:hypothetical protein
VKRFLFWCAGCVPDVIRDCPSEHPKYVSLGGAILATWLLAALSGGYAASVVFADSQYVWPMTIAVAVIWGWMLFNIDRSIITSMHKAAFGSAWERFCAEAPPAIPRLLLAMILAVTIADPLKVRLAAPDFEHILDEQDDARVARRAATLRASHAARLKDLGDDEAALRSELTAIETNLKTLEQQYFSELDGTGGSGRYGRSVVAESKKEIYDAAARAAGPTRERLTTRLQSALGERATIERSEVLALTAFRAALGRGYFSQRTAMATLASREPAVWWGTLAISLLVLVIEITPVLIKLLTPYGPYDERRRVAEELELFAAGRHGQTQRAILDRRYAVEEATGLRQLA